MAKVQFSDVVPPDRRTIRNIPIPNSGKRKAPLIVKPEPKIEKQEEFPIEDNVLSQENSKPVGKEINTTPYEFYYPKNIETKKITGHKSKNFVFGGIFFVVVIAFIFFMMTIFSSATVVVVPKTESIENVNINILASKTATSSDYVRYEVQEFSKSLTNSVVATGEEFVELKANGKIVIYNNFSSEPQRLITRTRFETPEGLIFRIAESVVVPGKSVVNGVSTPGSIEVEVFADEPGDKYNISKTDFTIPGFKNDQARYKGFYARSVGEIAGGFVGNMKTVLDEEREKTLSKIDLELKDLLDKEVKSKVPDGLVLLNNSIRFESKELPQKEEKEGVVIGKEMKAYAILLDRSDLSNNISQFYTNNPSWANISSEIRNFSLLGLSSLPDSFEKNELKLNITGKTNIIAVIQVQDFVQKLAGMDRRVINSFIQNAPSIKSMKVTLRPIWKRYFPEDTSKINLILDVE